MERSWPDKRCAFVLTVFLIALSTLCCSLPKEWSFTYVVENKNVPIAFVLDAVFEPDGAVYLTGTPDSWGMYGTTSLYRVSADGELRLLKTFDRPIFTIDIHGEDLILAVGQQLILWHSDDTYDILQTFEEDIYRAFPLTNHVLIGIEAAGDCDYHVVSLADGTITDSRDRADPSSTAAYAPQQGRIYMLTDGLFPNDIWYYEIDNTTGTIIGGGSSPYHGDYDFAHPLWISPNEQFLVTGEGNYFDVTGDITYVDELNDGVMPELYGPNFLGVIYYGWGEIDSCWFAVREYGAYPEAGVGGTDVWVDAAELPLEIVSLGHQSSFVRIVSFDENETTLYFTDIPDTAIDAAIELAEPIAFQ